MAKKIKAAVTPMKKIMSTKALPRHQGGSTAFKPTRLLKIRNLEAEEEENRNVQRFREKQNSALFFEYNMNLKPPYQVLLDTNFLNFSITNKLDVFRGLMDALLAKVNPCITDCVLGELESLGPKFRLALRIAKDPRFTRLTCDHKGIYADDCLVDRVKAHRCYLVATNDKDLKRRIRKIPGVPIIYVLHHQYEVERLPEHLCNIPLHKGKK